MNLTLDIRHRVERALFDRHDPSPVPFLDSALDFLRYPYAMGRDLLQGDLNLRAMSLVYTSLLSIVPLVAFGFAILKGLGVHRDLEPLIYEFLRPLGDDATQLTGQFMLFVENTRGGVLGSIGLAFLLWTVLSMIQKIEESFNFAWHVERPRSFIRRVSEYLALMVVGPVFLVVSFGLIGTLADYRIMHWLSTHEPFGGLVRLLGRAGPYLFVTAAFAFLYAFIPNTRVRLRAALIGGVTAGVLWAASGAVFARLALASTQWVAIYAGFAIFLLMLIWVYLSWLILLVGAQLSFYVQNPRYLRAGQTPIQLTSRLRERLALSVMYLVARDYATGQSQWRLRQLAERLEVPGSVLASVVQSLESAGLVTTTEDERLVPGRDMAGIHLSHVLSAVRDEQKYASWLFYRARTEPAADAVADAIDAAIRERTGDLTLSQFVRQNT
jgi:membrane protein